MDKFAQKNTAQEMIKANAAADAEELDKLQNQIKEYNECLIQMQQVNREMQEVSARMNKMSAVIPEMSQQLIPQMNQLIDESITKMKEIQNNQDAWEQLQDLLNEKFNISDEFVHKENVKVYRNVQAVVVEESNKQTEFIKNIFQTISGKCNAILGISIAALVAALGSVVFQILVYFKLI